MVSRQAISFLFASAGAALVSPADQTPFPLIKSSEIFHLSVSRPGRCCGGEQPSVSVDCVILQFTSDADNIIAASLMSPRLALVQPCAPAPLLSPLACLCGSDRSNTSACCLDPSPHNVRCREETKNVFKETGVRGHLMPKSCGSFIFKTLPFALGRKYQQLTHHSQASDSHACDLTPLAANVFSGAEPAWFRGWKFQSLLYHFPYHYSIHIHFSPRPRVPRGSGEAEKEGIVHPVPNFNMSGAGGKKKEKGGVIHY